MYESALESNVDGECCSSTAGKGCTNRKKGISVLPSYPVCRGKLHGRLSTESGAGCLQMHFFKTLNIPELIFESSSIKL